MIYIFDGVKNTLRKCWLPAFSPFPMMLSKGFFLRVVISWECVVKSYGANFCSLENLSKSFQTLLSQSLAYSQKCTRQMRNKKVIS